MPGVSWHCTGLNDYQDCGSAHVCVYIYIYMSIYVYCIYIYIYASACVCNYVHIQKIAKISHTLQKYLDATLGSSEAFYYTRHVLPLHSPSWSGCSTELVYSVGAVRLQTGCPVHAVVHGTMTYMFCQLRQLLLPVQHPCFIVLWLRAGVACLRQVRYDLRLRKTWPHVALSAELCVSVVRGFMLSFFINTIWSQPHHFGVQPPCS